MDEENGEEWVEVQKLVTQPTPPKYVPKLPTLKGNKVANKSRSFKNF